MTIDIALIKMPNHNIDYPHLAIPTLTSVLRNDGAFVYQADYNVELKNFLLEKTNLESLTYEILPEFAKYLIESSEDFDKIKKTIAYMIYLDTQFGFFKIQYVKELFQSRQYNIIYTDESLVHIASELFVLTGLLHSIIDFSISINESNIVLDCNDIIIDFFNQKTAELLKLSPRIIGFSVLQIQRKATLWFAKKISPLTNAKIVVGGPDVSTFPYEYIENHNFIDVGFIKESEVSLLDYINGKPLETIRGIVYKNEGEIRVNPLGYDNKKACFVPDFDGLKLDQYLLPTLPISSSRGCKYAKCKFCNHHKTVSGYYKNNAIHTVDTIDYLSKKYKTNMFHFVDDMLEFENGTRIADDIIDRGLDLYIITYARFENSFNTNTLQKWRKAGIRVIEWGLESASPKLLKQMSKGITINKVQEILNCCSSAGIVNKLMLFHNYPGETTDDLKQTINFLFKNVEDRKVRPFFTIYGKMELRLDTPLEIMTRDPNQIIFKKRYERSSSFDSLFGYLDEKSYECKVNLLEELTENVSSLMKRRKIISTNDENMSIDLVIQKLIDDNYILHTHIQ